MFYNRTKKISKLLSNGEAVIIKNDVNRFYFTSFSSSAGMLVITSNKTFFLVDFRYFEKAKKQISNAEVILSGSFISTAVEIFEKENISKIYLEISDTSLVEFNNYCEKISFAKISDDAKIEKEILKMRSVKDESEFESIKAAQKLTDETFSYILSRIKNGVTEREVMLDMEFFIRKSGSEGVAFDFIVVSGKNSSLPHGIPTDKKIENGDFITLDFGAVVNGYRSDMTRTIALGNITDEQRQVYNTVLSAQKKALEIIKSGANCCDIDKVARDIIYSAGYEGKFGHSLGHSVGLEIHENPCFSPKSQDVLESGMVLTVEPGIYLEDKFGVRIEDMVYVTDDGCINITKSKKELIIL